MTIPSCHRIPILSFFGSSISRQGIGTHFGSTSHGSESITVFENNLMSFKSLDIGPLTLTPASCPAIPDLVSKCGNLPKDGRRVKIPQHAAGIRKEPPILN